jgi:ATP-binding cassette subfamily B protein
MINPRLLNLLKDAKKYVYFQVLSLWFILILRILMTFTISYLGNDFIKGSLSRTKILSGFIFSLFSLISSFFLDRFYIRTTAKVSLSVKSILRKKIYSKLLRLGLSYNENFATSNLVQLSVEGVDQLEVCFGQYLSQLYYSFLSAITTFIAIYIITPAASIALLLCVPLIPISIVIVQVIAITVLGKYWKSYTNLGETFLENLQGLTTLKIYQYDGQKSIEMDNQAEKFRIETMKVLVMQLNSLSIMDIMTYGGGAIGMLVALYKYKNGVISFGGVMTVVMLSAEYFIPLRRLGSFFHVAMNGITASKKIFEFLDLKEHPNKILELESNQPFNIALNNVCFSFKEDKTILKNLNFSIKPKEFISFVGESGCGKSTLARILSGNLTNYSGSINIQGKELNTINEESISKNIVVISSDSYIFKGTIKDNLLMAKENATNEEMINIIKEVKLTEIFDKNGLDTIIEEEGSNLSGGQKQKLALARGLLVDAPFYIFDEATSNIDKESEADIMKVIKSIVGKKNILLISHRLGNVVDCEKIYLLHDGEIKESGTHEELYQLRNEYYKLFNTQQELENYSSNHKKMKKINTYNISNIKKEEELVSEKQEKKSINEDEKKLLEHHKNVSVSE